MPNTLLPGNTKCFPLEAPATNLDEYGFFSYYDPNSKPCSFQQEFYRKKYFLDERVGAATGISRSSVVVHGGLVLDIVDELMNEYSKKLEIDEDMQKATDVDKEDPLFRDENYTSRRNILTSANIHNAWLQKTLQNIDDAQHDEMLLEKESYDNHNHAISDCLSNQLFQLDLITRKWHHVPTFLEDFGPLLKPRMCQSIVCDKEFLYMSGGLIPVNKSELKSLVPIKSVLSTHTSASDMTESSHSSHINEDQLLLATNELWRLDITSKIFLCINDEIDNSNIPERYNHQMHIATFIEKFEVDEKYENKTKTDEKVHLVNTGKTISIKGKKYIEKMVQKLILVGGLGIDDQEIMKIDVFNLETQQWESGPRGPYKDLRLEFPFTTEFETSVVLDNPLTGESNIIIYKKDALNPLQVIPLIQRNTYDIDGHIIPELCNYSEDKFEESSTSDTIRINTQKFDEKLRFLNRKIIYPKMRIFGPNLLVSGYCSEHNKDIVLKDHPDNEMISVETLLPDTIPKTRLDVLDKHTEKNLVFKSFCFSLVNGKWIEINCECIGDRKCEHHMLSEVFVWASHHKLLFIGSSDYQKHPKTSTIGLNRLSPILQKFDLIMSTSLNVTSLFYKISLITNEDESFIRAQKLFFSSQDHNYTLLNYLTFSTSHSIGSISNNDIKRFKEFAEYSTPVSDLTANQSIMPPYSMLLGKTLFSSYGVQISDFEIVPSNGEAIPCCLAVLRKRWGRYFDSLLAHGYVESINILDEHTPSNDGSKFSSLSSFSKNKKNSLLPYLQREKSKGSTSSSLKNSFSLNIFSEQIDIKNNQQPPSFNYNYSEKFSEQPLSQNVSPHNSKLNITNLNNDLDAYGKKAKNHNIFKNEFLSKSLNDVEEHMANSFITKDDKKDSTGETISKENFNSDAEDDPLSRSRTADDARTTSRRGSILSRETFDSQNSKSHAVTSSNGGMVFRIPFHTDAHSVSSDPTHKIASKNTNNVLNQTRHESISSQVKRLSETRRKSLTTSSHLGETSSKSRTHSINSDYNKPMNYILPDIDVANMPKMAKKPSSKPPLPPQDSTISNNIMSTLNNVYNNLNLNNSTNSSNMGNRRRLSIQKNEAYKRGMPSDDSPSGINLNNLHKGGHGRRRSSLLSNSSDNDRPNISINEKLLHNLGSITSAFGNSNHNSISLDGSLEPYNDEDTNTTINNNKASFSTINEYNSKMGSVSSSQRSQSVATEESTDSVVNAELEPLMIPRSLYIPWPHESVLAFTEFFYTGQINPKWSFQPVALDVFLMAKLYEVPLLYDAMSEVFYSLIGKKEEHIYILKDKFDQKFKNCVKRYIKATNSKESVDSYLSKSTKYQKFRDLDKPLQNIDYGYCDYLLLKNPSTVLDLKEEELFELGSSLNYKYSTPDSSVNRTSSINYLDNASKNSEFNFQNKKDLYSNSEYSGVSPKSSISKNINHNNSSNGLDLKITAMKKNSLNKFQLYNSEANKNSVSSETANNYARSSDLKDSPKLESSSFKNNNDIGSYPQLFNSYNSTEPLRSDSGVSFSNELLFTELNDLLTEDYDFTTSSSSDSSENEFESMNKNFELAESGSKIKNSSIGELKSDYSGSGTAKSESTSSKKVSNTNYGFGLISPAKMNEKIETCDIEADIGVDATLKKENPLSIDNTINEFVNSGMSEDSGNNKKIPDPKGEDGLFAKSKNFNLGSVTLEKLSSYELKNTVEFIIEMIYEVSTHCYDLMLSIRSRNCLELCKMYKKVIKEINIEILKMEKQMNDIRHHRNEAQKAQVAQTFTNLPQGSPNIAPRSSASTNDFSTVNSSRINTMVGNKTRDISVKKSIGTQLNSRANFDIISNSNNNTDNTSISSSASSSKSKHKRFFGRKKDSGGHAQDENSSIASTASPSTAPKKTVLDNIKPLKPKRSISLLNIFKKKS
ncbi:hypothetical protein FOG48_01456 [Hanseniaspora uvarum]|nr:hypothetical protein FOG48_01456 [Hanseniaspora uvarum]